MTVFDAGWGQISDSYKSCIVACTEMTTHFELVFMDNL